MSMWPNIIGPIQRRERETINLFALWLISHLTHSTPGSGKPLSDHFLGSAMGTRQSQSRRVFRRPSRLGRLGPWKRGVYVDSFLTTESYLSGNAKLNLFASLLKRNISGNMGWNPQGCGIRRNCRIARKQLNENRKGIHPHFIRSCAVLLPKGYKRCGT